MIISLHKILKARALTSDLYFLPINDSFLLQHSLTFLCHLTVFLGIGDSSGTYNRS